ncbi:hypothetical protein OG728_39060 (plasmid) [Streptomyces microflavus]|uniref:hypothetical protein n=1 Tax=Streptomyces microflavus TaxID=1919 RepID=UPI002E0D1B17|nr:hypothetical protein OG728_39060 [Streptomyces microflavus]
MDVNQYGRMAEQHWQEHRPGSISAIGDPESFFTELGTDVQNEVRARWTAGRVNEAAVAGESFLERAGRLQQLRREAEGEVLRELVLLPADGDPDLADDPHFTVAQITEEQWRQQHLHDLLAGLSQAGDYSPAERARLRAGAPERLLELTGLSDADLGGQGLL